jgi:hypothetical protein
MKEKITISIDVTKIDKSKIVDRKYTNKEGKEVLQRLYKLDIIPVKDERMVKDGGTWKIVKTHFVAESQTPEERKTKTKGIIIGDGVVIRNNDHGVDMGGDRVDESQIPF